MDEDEITRCYRLLGLEPGSSLEEVQKAYRDLVQVWHPDRFTSNERLQSKAQEQLKEINLAYEYLLAKAATQITPVEQSESREPSPGPAPPEDQSQDFSVEPEEQGRGRNVLWNILFLFAGLVLIASGILWWGGHHKTNTVSTTPVDIEATSVSSESNAVAAVQQQATNIGEGSLAQHDHPGWLSRLLMAVGL